MTDEQYECFDEDGEPLVDRNKYIQEWVNNTAPWFGLELPIKTTLPNSIGLDTNPEEKDYGFLFKDTSKPSID